MKKGNCVYNTSSIAYRKALEIHEKECDCEYYPRLEDVQMSICYKCNGCNL